MKTTENIEKEYLNKAEALLKKPVYIVDYLPRTVPKDSSGSFFDVEYYLLNSDKKIMIKNRFSAVILKLMCYYKMLISWGHVIENPDPGEIDKIINEIMESFSGSLNCLFPDIDMLLVFSWDSLNLDIYHPPETILPLLKEIAMSEGLFFREGMTTDDPEEVS